MIATIRIKALPGRKFEVIEAELDDDPDYKSEPMFLCGTNACPTACAFIGWIDICSIVPCSSGYYFKEIENASTS